MLDALTASGIQCTIAPETEVRALVAAAKAAADDIVSTYRSEYETHRNQTPEENSPALPLLRAALAPFSESPTEPLTAPTEDRQHKLEKLACQIIWLAWAGKRPERGGVPFELVGGDWLRLVNQAEEAMGISAAPVE